MNIKGYLTKDKITGKDLRDARELYRKRIEELDPDRKAALALSGGTDSVTILFAMLDTGRKPRCYTFYVDGIESTDLLSSRALCKHFGLELVECKLPSDIDSIARDVASYIAICEVIKKTVVQCMHPWLYIYPAMKERGDDLILNGLGGDELYCNQRKQAIRLHREGEAAMIPARSVCYSSDTNFSGGNIINYGRVAFEIDNVDFYDSQEIRDFFLQFKLSILSKPMEKWLSAGPYPDYYSQGKFYRRHDSYQINSGLKLAHEKLLQSNVYNPKGKRDVRPIYNAIYDGRV